MSKDLGQQPRLRPGDHGLIGSLVGAIEKAIELPVVSVQVAKYPDSIGLLGRQPDAILKEIQLWMQGSIRFSPPTIQVDSSQRRSRIADDNAIWVDHRNYLDDVIVQ